MPTWKKVIVSGSNAVLNSVTASNGFFGTASYAVTASYALSSPGGAAFPYTGDAAITGSLLVSSSAGEGFLNTKTGILKYPNGIEIDLANQTITGDAITVDLLFGNVTNIGGAGFVLDPFSPTLFDNNSNNSVEWDGRYLYDSVGNTALAWTNTGPSNGVRLYGTASYALTASFVVGGTSNVKAGSGSAALFGGSPRTGSITFGTAFSNNNYAVTVTGEDARSWTIENKSSNGFRINSNSSVALTGPVYWIATPFSS